MSNKLDSSSVRSNFWQNYGLDELTYAEWESLCDGCGICCLIKFLDDDESDELVEYTDVACRLLDCDTGQCGDYANRRDFVPDCIQLKYEQLPQMMWLPNTCAYKRLYLGLGLPDWHFLLTNNREQTQRLMYEDNVGVAGRCVSELGMSDEEMEERVVTWVAV